MNDLTLPDPERRKQVLILTPYYYERYNNGRDLSDHSVRNSMSVCVISHGAFQVWPERFRSHIGAVQGSENLLLYQDPYDFEKYYSINDRALFDKFIESRWAKFIEYCNALGAMWVNIEQVSHNERVQEISGGAGAGAKFAEIELSGEYNSKNTIMSSRRVYTRFEGGTADKERAQELKMSCFYGDDFCEGMFNTRFGKNPIRSYYVECEMLKSIHDHINLSVEANVLRYVSAGVKADVERSQKESITLKVRVEFT